MRLRQIGLAVGLAALAGCTSPTSSGVLTMGPDVYGVKVASGDLAAAVEMGVSDANTFCGGMGRQTRLLRSQVTTEDYQLLFRCTGSAAAVAPPAAPVPTIAGMAIPNPNAPAVAGAAFPPPRSVTAELPAAANRTAVFPVNPPLLSLPAASATPASALLPALADTRGGRTLPSVAAPAHALPLVAAPAVTQPDADAPYPLAPLAPLTSPGLGPMPEPQGPGLLDRLFGSSEASRLPTFPADGPGPATASAGLFPAPVGPAPSSAPLRSPVAPAGLAERPLPPISGPTPLMSPPPRGLPPVPLQPLPRLSTNVPGTLPPPALNGGGAATVPQPVSSEPPTAFWQNLRN